MSPYELNYPQKITTENAVHHYKTGSRMMRALNSIVAIGFAYATYATIQTALGMQEGLTTMYLPVFNLILFGTIGYFVFRSVAIK